ncbi:MAG TPA: hypothetical protein VG267_22695 [Terracidiphilus sp.]|jgi:hypothetical protein|nr:hypothetical protein [Terracidiphilus sp.]
MQSSDISASVSSKNPAVQQCIEAGRIVFEEELAKGTDKYKADCAAREAYRNAMPHLSGAQNIQDFIACTAVAVLRGLMYESESTRLLYAAQIASGALARQPAPKLEPKAEVSAGSKPPVAQAAGVSTPGESKVA